MSADKLPLPDTILLAIPCVEHCGEAMLFRLPLEPADIEPVIAAKGWYLSAMGPRPETVWMGLLCGTCAKRVHDPSVLAEMDRVREGRKPS